MEFLKFSVTKFKLLIHKFYKMASIHLAERRYATSIQYCCDSNIDDKCIICDRILYTWWQSIHTLTDIFTNIYNKSCIVATKQINGLNDVKFVFIMDILINCNRGTPSGVKNSDACVKIIFNVQELKRTKFMDQKIIRSPILSQAQEINRFSAT